MPALSINIDRLWQDIETLATFSAGGEGVNRLTFSEEDRAARATTSESWRQGSWTGFTRLTKRA